MNRTPTTCFIGYRSFLGFDGKIEHCTGSFEIIFDNKKEPPHYKFDGHHVNIQYAGTKGIPGNKYSVYRAAADTPESLPQVIHVGDRISLFWSNAGAAAGYPKELMFGTYQVCAAWYGRLGHVYVDFSYRQHQAHVTRVKIDSTNQTFFYDDGKIWTRWTGMATHLSKMPVADMPLLDLIRVPLVNELI